MSESGAEPESISQATQFHQALLAGLQREAGRWGVTLQGDHFSANEGSSLATSQGYATIATLLALATPAAEESLRDYARRLRRLLQNMQNRYGEDDAGLAVTHAMSEASGLIKDLYQEMVVPELYRQMQGLSNFANIAAIQGVDIPPEIGEEYARLQHELAARPEWNLDDD